MGNYLLNIICWGIFALVWVIGGIYNYYKVPVAKKEKSSKSIWSIIIGVVAYRILERYIPRSLWTFITYENKWLTIIGAIILVLSTIFTIWSRFILGKMWSSDAEIKEEHKLRIEGPYNITRHPIYTGISGMLLGSTLMNGFGYVLILSICVFIFLKMKINIEEKLLTEEFDKEYLDYTRRTPQLFPLLKLFRRNLL